MRAEGNHVVGDTAVEVDEVPNRELRDGDGVLAGAVRHVDAARAGGLQVDGVHPRAGADDEREGTTRPDVGRRDLGAADHDHVRVERRDARRERRILQRRINDDLGAGVLQAAGHERSEFVGDENTHRVSGDSGAQA